MVKIASTFARSVAGAGRSGVHATRGSSSPEGKVVSCSLSRFDVNLEPAGIGEMETLIDSADTTVRIRLSDSLGLGVGVGAGGRVILRDARHGLRSGVGEAENPGPPTQDCSAPATVCCSEDRSVPATIGGRFFSLADECDVEECSEPEILGS